MDTPIKQTIIFDNTAKLKKQIEEFKIEFDELKKEFDEFNTAKNKVTNIISKYSHLGPS